MVGGPCQTVVAHTLHRTSAQGTPEAVAVGHGRTWSMELPSDVVVCAQRQGRTRWRQPQVPSVVRTEEANYAWACPHGGYGKSILVLMLWTPGVNQR